MRLIYDTKTPPKRRFEFVVPVPRSLGEVVPVPRSLGEVVRPAGLPRHRWYLRGNRNKKPAFYAGF